MTALFWFLVFTAFALCIPTGIKLGRDNAFGAYVGIVGGLIFTLAMYISFATYAYQTFSPIREDAHLIKVHNMYRITYKVPDWNPISGVYRREEHIGDWFTREEADLQYAEFVKGEEKAVEVVK